MSSTTPAASPLARALVRFAPVEAREAPVVIAAFCLFFCFWAGYFTVRPVRETVGTIIGRERTADLWMVTWAASLIIVPLYGVIVARVRRTVFLPLTYGFVGLVLALVGLALRGDQLNVLVGQIFYVFISVLNLFLISMFWSFLLELLDSQQAKRLFPVIAAGGTAGAFLAPFATDILVKQIGNSGVLFVGASLFFLAIVAQRVLLRLWHERPVREAAATPEKPIGGNPFAGFTLVLRSPYLLGIALFVVLLSTVSTLLYFEQLRLVQEAFSDPAERTRIFARLDWIVNGLAIVSQLFITGRVAKKFGVTPLITLVPLALVFGFLALAATGTLTVLMVVFVLRRATEYAFVRPGREMLYSPLDNETRYKAKNVNDVPVYRGADALSAQVSNALSAGGAGASVAALLGAAVAAVWGLVGWWLGRRVASGRVGPGREAQQQAQSG
ncbi:MAG TPA: Npt1/Npt2 family nucleotide transporter [Steroidobacteraceae bacterium]|jgi:AAA family ATP:ADP antiporter|nr:Npt1/Npt2 family nucleotide transporter [Steroidobacteraceae bacterium]